MRRLFHARRRSIAGRDVLPPFQPRASCAPVALLVALLAVTFWSGSGEERLTDEAPRPAIAAPAKVRRPVRTEHASAPAKPKARRTTARAAAPAPRKDRGDVFRGLGAWIDLYDFDLLRPAATIARMRRAGVRTIYIQTGRSNTPYRVSPRSGPWLVAAHRAGIEVVGWYLPYYRSLAHDVRRTVAIAGYRYRGHRFDGVGIDVEFRGAVRRQGVWMRRVARHARIVRDRLPRVPVASIPPTPLQMRVAPGYWAGFPWRAIGRNSDAILLMSYWSDRIGCPRIRLHCAYQFTAENVARTRRLAQNPDVLVHVIGGVGDRISYRELRMFVRGARDAGADGASIYDVVTTRPGWWRTLARLRGLGIRGRPRTR